MSYTWSKLSLHLLALGPDGPLLSSGQGMFGPHMPCPTRRTGERGAWVFFPLSVFREEAYFIYSFQLSFS